MSIGLTVADFVGHQIFYDKKLLFFGLVTSSKKVRAVTSFANRFLKFSVKLTKLTT